MEACTPNHKKRFINDIIEALHMKMDTFIYNLAHNHPYELLLYLWIDKLYSKGKTSGEAVQVIYKARNIFLLSSGYLVVGSEIADDVSNEYLGVMS